MNVVMASNAEAHLFNMNSLEFPAGHLPGVRGPARSPTLGSMDVVMTNPPFGSDIPITDPSILRNYDLAHIWERTEDGGFRNTGRLQGSVAPEVLFIERCYHWLKPGGRMGIVLPDGILGNPGDEYIRWWILRHCWVLASVDLPVEVFIVEANVNILTSLLFLKKKTEQEMQAEDLGATEDYSGLHGRRGEGRLRPARQHALQAQSRRRRYPRRGRAQGARPRRRSVRRAGAQAQGEDCRQRSAGDRTGRTWSFATRTRSRASEDGDHSRVPGYGRMASASIEGHTLAARVRCRENSVL